MKKLLMYATLSATASTFGLSSNYPLNDVNQMLANECAKRGIVIVDYHTHLRGGMTVEKSCQREQAWVVKGSAMDNHGRDWETKTNQQLSDFADKVRAISKTLPIGIQVNDRDWFEQINATTRAKFDYILADSMIFGNDPNWQKNCLWNPQTIPDPEKWMDGYVEHNLRILDEPISILANPTYLPIEIAGNYDKLWTEERMRRVIAKTVERGIAIEIQAESPFPRPKFLRLAKSMGAKFSFGTNNFDDKPKDLTHWLDVITWLDLQKSDIWTPQNLKTTTNASTHNDKISVTITTTMGDITLELNAAKAPISVSNFVMYAKSGHYNDTIFHRVINNFMIQGGGFTVNMEQKETQPPIKNEATNGLKNMRGTIAMARTMIVDSATCQFFINLKDNTFLDYTAPNPRQFGYAVFGHVTKGMEVVDKIAQVRTGSMGYFRDVPIEPIIIKNIKIEE